MRLYVALDRYLSLCLNFGSFYSISTSGSLSDSSHVETMKGELNGETDIFYNVINVVVIYSYNRMKPPVA